MFVEFVLWVVIDLVLDVGFGLGCLFIVEFGVEFVGLVDWIVDEIGVMDVDDFVFVEFVVKIYDLIGVFGGLL